MLPSRLTAGDTVTWIQDKTIDELDNEINSDDWTLVYSFRKTGAATGAVINTTGQPNQAGGWDFSFLINSAQPVGTYYYVAQATNIATPTVIKTISNGQIEIVGSLTVATTFDGRTQARQDLDAVQSAMRTMISGGAVEEYTIGTRSIRKMKMADLIVLESKLKVIVIREEKAERIAQGLGNPNNMFVRFR